MSTLETVAYSHAGKDLTGYLARPAGTPRAAVVVFPTIANVDPHIERRAQMLADLGYIAMIADFYGDPVESFEASFPMAGALREDNAFYRARIRAAFAKLREIAPGLPMLATGYCMGGGAILEAARDGEDILALATFHATLSTEAPAAPGGIKPRILVCHGDADPLVPHDQVIAFWDEMNAADADWHFHSYGKVKHGFTATKSDTMGKDFLAYSQSADRQSWTSMVAFFDETLG
ncbi:dienelactone hydrolase family protein [Novosphingobium sp. 9]|uniref:dienelactone hydrolase family protein n=1 Tax=Novosphingobium sp. 9 TaxID=2025349 RepID=UPI0021B6E2C5|nr:dienelactone hydrolase family protein [Novosphingobium sp. 9]